MSDMNTLTLDKTETGRQPQMSPHSQKPKKKILKKIVLAILTVLLMIGISVVVANIVHRSGDVGDSSKVENGLSAYELAVQQGYDGSVQEWLASLSGKSAYEIAVDSGYTGTEEEWASALAAFAKQENKDIKTASFSEKGELLITLSDNTVLNLGKAVGADGIDGINGIDGKDGKDGINGTNGIDGKDGVGINSIAVNESYELEITLSSGTKLNLGNIKGADGKDGINGTDGIGVAETTVNELGELVITYSDGRSVNLGKVVGADGKDGANGTNGVDGQDGIGVAESAINENGELIITYSDSKFVNLGKIVGSDGRDGKDGITPQIRVNAETGEWEVSTDNGATWISTGAKAVGIDGKDGVNGSDGKDGVGIANVTISPEGALTVELTSGTVLNLGNIKGENGIGITKSEISTDGELILTYTDGKTENLGAVVGRDGTDGKDGADGQNGVGIKSVTLSADGELIVLMTDNSVTNLGNIKGEKGEPGAQGEKGDKGDKGDPGRDGIDGKDGRGIAKTELFNGELVITYTDGTIDNLGIISETNELPEYYFGYTDYTVLYSGSSGYAIGLNPLYQNTISYVKIPSEYNGIPIVAIGARIRNQTWGNTGNLYDTYFGFQSRTLKTVIIPSSIEYIDKQAFNARNLYGQSHLEKAIFEQTSDWFRSKSNSMSDGIEWISIPEETMKDSTAAANLLNEGYALFHK